MMKEFFRYFFSYIFFSKSKQHLLLLSLIGLFISSFSLFVLQSTMGGLQGNLTARSKKVLGDASIFLISTSKEQTQKLREVLSKIPELTFKEEKESELLLKKNNLITPVVVHGIDEKNLPYFLEGEKFKDLIITQDIAFKLQGQMGQKMRLLSPGSVDSFVEEIPRMGTLFVDGIISTDVPEIDSFHIWVRKSFLENLMKKIGVNKLRLFYKKDFTLIKETLTNLDFQNFEFKTWEEENSNLVWALKLESVVMIFLFTAMTMLVALCISSGLMIFFGKIKKDLTAFWILGTSKKRLGFSLFSFFNVASFLTVSLGILSACLFLYFLDRFGGNIMPDVFIDRKIPIHFSFKIFFISFIIPFGISFLFSTISLFQFKNEREELLEEIRTAS